MSRISKIHRLRPYDGLVATADVLVQQEPEDEEEDEDDSDGEEDGDDDGYSE
jgi:hypothetical protein